MSLNSFYNSKYNNADIINYKYSSFVPKINNSKPNFFPKIHSKFSQKYAPIIKTTFGTTPLLSDRKINQKTLKTQLTHSNYDLPLYSWYLDNKILLDYNLKSNFRYHQYNSMPEINDQKNNSINKQNILIRKLPSLAKRFQPMMNTETIQYTKDYIQFIRNKPLQLKPIQGANNQFNQHSHSHLRNNFDPKKDFDFSFEWYTPSGSEYGDNEEDLITNSEKSNGTLKKQSQFVDENLLDFNT